jgi:hypothetical protein
MFASGVCQVKGPRPLLHPRPARELAHAGADPQERLIDVLTGSAIRDCVIGGQAVNAFAEPLVSLDLAAVAEDLPRAEAILEAAFVLKRFPPSLSLSLPGTDLRAQVQTDPRYAEFVSRASPREVLGLELKVASAEDVLQGKVWAALDPGRRPSKRQKDLADIARLIESLPVLRSRLPPKVLARLV